MKKTEELIIKVEINDSTLIIPESSVSANFIHVTFEKGVIYVKECNEIPKIILNLKPQEEKLLVIDKKFTFNVKSQKALDLFSFTKIEIMASKLNLMFYINKVLDPIGDIQNFALTIRAPKDEEKSYHFRLDEWKKTYNAECVIPQKPSMSFKIDDADIGTNIVIKFFRNMT